MRKISILIVALFISTTAHATLTVNNVPRTKTGGSAPALQDSDITDVGGNVGIGSPNPTQVLDVAGTVKANAFSGPLTGNVTGNLTGNVIGNVTGSSGSTTGNAATATSLASPPSQCSAGNYFVGIDSSGNAQGCSPVGSASAAGQTNAVQYNGGSSTFAGDATKFYFNGTNIGIGTSSSNGHAGNSGGTGIPADGATFTVVGIGTTNNEYAVMNVKNSANQLLATFLNNGTIGIGNTGQNPFIDPYDNLKSRPLYNTSHQVTALNAASEQDGIGNTIGILGTGYRWPSVSVNATGVTYGVYGQGSDTNAKAGSIISGNMYGVFGDNFFGSSVTTRSFSAYGVFASQASVFAGPPPDHNFALGANGFSVFSGTVGIGTAQGDSYTTTFPPSGGMLIYGNIGIGSLAPGQKLDVVGTIRASSDVKVGANSVLQAGTLDDTKYCIYSSGSGTVNCTSSGSGSTLPGGNNTAIQYNSSGTFGGDETKLSFNGTNVGIGSTAPGVSLDVQGAIRASTSIGVGTYSVCTTQGTCPGSISGSSQWTTVNTNDVFLPNNGNVGLGTNLTSTSALAVMNGNVGIGTWKPVGSLNIIGGNVSIGTTASSFMLTVGSTGIFQVSSAGGVNYASMAGGSVSSTGNVTSSATSSSWGGASGTAGSQSVFIGGNSTTSQAKLRSTSANGTTDAVVLQLGNGGTTTGMILQDNSGTVNVGIGTTLPSSLLEVGAQKFNILSNGNVGIGSLAPQATLDLGTSGTLVSHRTTGLGFSEHNATNQACNTTCGSSACVISLDIGTVGVINSGFVACSDATADDCLCAGP